MVVKRILWRFTEQIDWHRYCPSPRRKPTTIASRFSYVATPHVLLVLENNKPGKLALNSLALNVHPENSHLYGATSSAKIICFHSETPSSSPSLGPTVRGSAHCTLA